MGMEFAGNVYMNDHSQHNRPITLKTYKLHCDHQELLFVTELPMTFCKIY